MKPNHIPGEGSGLRSAAPSEKKGPQAGVLDRMRAFVSMHPVMSALGIGALATGAAGCADEAQVTVTDSSVRFATGPFCPKDEDATVSTKIIPNGEEFVVNAAIPTRVGPLWLSDTDIVFNGDDGQGEVTLDTDCASVVFAIKGMTEELGVLPTQNMYVGWTDDVARAWTDPHGIDRDVEAVKGEATFVTAPGHSNLAVVAGLRRVDDRAYDEGHFENNVRIALEAEVEARLAEEAEALAEAQALIDAAAEADAAADAGATD